MERGDTLATNLTFNEKTQITSYFDKFDYCNGIIGIIN